MAIKLIFKDAENNVETQVVFVNHSTLVNTANGRKAVSDLVAGVDSYLFPNFGPEPRLIDEIVIDEIELS